MSRCPTPLFAVRGRTLQADRSAAILEQQQLENPSATSPLSQACSARSGHFPPLASGPAYIARPSDADAKAARREGALLALSLVHDFLAHYSLSRCAQTKPCSLLPCIIVSCSLTYPRSTAAVLRPESNVDDGALVVEPPLFYLRHRLQQPQRCSFIHTAATFSRLVPYLHTRVGVIVQGAALASRCAALLSQSPASTTFPPRCCSSLVIPASSAASGQSLLERLISSRSSSNASSTSASASSSAAASKSLPPLKPAPALASKFNFSSDAAPQSRCSLHSTAHCPSRAAPSNGDAGRLSSSTVPVESRRRRSLMTSRLTRMEGRRKA